MRRVIVGTVLAGLVSTAVLAQSADERAAARAVVAKQSNAVVVVLATVKLRINVAGREQSNDQAAQTNGTILDASGLTVFSLQQIQPDETLTRMYSRQMPSGTGKIEVTSEPSDIKMHLADGRELPAKLVLRDTDLDLAFIRPTEPLTVPLPYVDAPSAKAALLDTLTVVRRTSEASGWLAGASFGNVELVIDKPRTYYLVPSAVSNPGAPVFDMAGRFVGVLLMRDTGNRGTTAPAILPADDIREVAKQAAIK